MSTNANRYKAWSDALIETLNKGDVDAFVSLWADNCSHEQIDPFDEGKKRLGLSEMREYARYWAQINDLHLLKNEILLADTEHGVGNMRVTWTNLEGEFMGCDHIYQVSLDADGRATAYKEWNVVRPKDEGFTPHD